MSDRRIRVPIDKSDLIDKLRYTEENKKGVFKQYSEIMSFCAMLGYKCNKYIPFEGGSYIDPIRQDVFVRSGQDKLFYLLAMAKTEDPNCLSNDDSAEELRISTFESYANGGLDELRERLFGKEDPLDYLLLMIGFEKPATNITTVNLEK